MKNPNGRQSTNQNHAFMPHSHTTHYDWNDDESLSNAVIQAVAAVNGHEPMEIQPLYEVVDPDALGSLFTPGTNTVPVTTGCVSFMLDGTEVTVYTSGEIVVELLESK